MKLRSFCDYYRHCVDKKRWEFTANCLAQMVFITSDNVGVCSFGWGGSKGGPPKTAGVMRTHPCRPQMCYWEINEN